MPIFPLPTTTTTTVCVVLLKRNDEIYSYDVVTNQTSLLNASIIGNIPSTGGIAHTQDKMFIQDLSNGTIIEFLLTLNPFSAIQTATYNCVPYSIFDPIFRGLGAMNNTTLFAAKYGTSGPTNELLQITIAGGNANVSTLFSTISGRRLHGDFIYTTGGKIIYTNHDVSDNVYITQVDYSSLTQEFDIDITGAIGLTSPHFTLFEQNGDLYFCVEDETLVGTDLYRIDTNPPYSINLIQTIPINGIVDSSQSTGCNSVNFLPECDCGHLDSIYISSSELVNSIDDKIYLTYQDCNYGQVSDTYDWITPHGSDFRLVFSKFYTIGNVVYTDAPCFNTSLPIQVYVLTNTGLTSINFTSYYVTPSDPAYSSYLPTCPSCSSAVTTTTTSGQQCLCSNYSLYLSWQDCPYGEYFIFQYTDCNGNLITKYFSSGAYIGNYDGFDKYLVDYDCIQDESQISLTVSNGNPITYSSPIQGNCCLYVTTTTTEDPTRCECIVIRNNNVECNISYTDCDGNLVLDVISSGETLILCVRDYSLGDCNLENLTVYNLGQCVTDCGAVKCNCYSVTNVELLTPVCLIDYLDCYGNLITQQINYGDTIQYCGDYPLGSNCSSQSFSVEQVGFCDGLGNCVSTTTTTVLCYCFLIEISDTTTTIPPSTTTSTTSSDTTTTTTEEVTTTTTETPACSDCRYVDVFISGLDLNSANNYAQVVEFRYYDCNGDEQVNYYGWSADVTDNVCICLDVALTPEFVYFDSLYNQYTATNSSYTPTQTPCTSQLFNQLPQKKTITGCLYNGVDCNGNVFNDIILPGQQIYVCSQIEPFAYSCTLNILYSGFCGDIDCLVTTTTTIPRCECIIIRNDGPDCSISYTECLGSSVSIPILSGETVNICIDGDYTFIECNEQAMVIYSLGNCSIECSMPKCECYSVTTFSGSCTFDYIDCNLNLITQTINQGENFTYCGTSPLGASCDINNLDIQRIGDCVSGQCVSFITTTTTITPLICTYQWIDCSGVTYTGTVVEGQEIYVCSYGEPVMLDCYLDISYLGDCNQINCEPTTTTTINT